MASWGVRLIEEMVSSLGVELGTAGTEGDFGGIVGWINSVKPVEDIM